MALSGPKTVHIAAQGYETERVYKPAIDNDTDKIILVDHKENSEKGIECLEKVQNKLQETDIDCETTECNFFDIYSVLWTFAELIHEHREEAVFVNISTGSKLTAIGGMIACMATGAKPFYVRATGYTGQTVATGAGETVPLSAYPISLPDEQYLKVLNRINTEGSMNKKELIEFASDLPLLSQINRDEQKNMYEPVDREIIEPLRERGFIDVTKIGNEVRLRLTEDGENVLEVFNYLLNDSPS